MDHIELLGRINLIIKIFNVIIVVFRFYVINAMWWIVLETHMGVGERSLEPPCGSFSRFTAHNVSCESTE